jgi:hypothetical protein
MSTVIFYSENETGKDLRSLKDCSAFVSIAKHLLQPHVNEKGMISKPYIEGSSRCMSSSNRLFGNFDATSL